MTLSILTLCFTTPEILKAWLSLWLHTVCVSKQNPEEVMPLCMADYCSERSEHKHFQMIQATQELSLICHLWTTITQDWNPPHCCSQECKKNPPRFAPKPTELLIWAGRWTGSRQRTLMWSRVTPGCGPCTHQCLCHVQIAEGQEMLNLTRCSHNRVNIDILLTQTPAGREEHRERIPGLPGQVFSDFSFQTLILISHPPSSAPSHNPKPTVHSAVQQPWSFKEALRSTTPLQTFAWAGPNPV